MRLDVALYKILAQPDWLNASAFVPWSDDDRRDAFMHLSTGDQVLETAARHFAGQKGLVALEIDEAIIAKALRYEPSRGGALFPHLYGELPRKAVLRVRRLVEAGGAFHFEDEKR